jgi:MFS family permease
MARSPSTIRLLQLVAVVSTLDRYAMPPMLVAIALDLDVALSSVVHAAGAYFLTYGLMQPVWGTVSDQLGRVRTLRLTLVLAGLCGFSSAFVATPVMLGVARGLTGAFFGAAYPSALIYLGDTVPVRFRQREIARLMVGVAIGTAVASIGAGVLAQWSSWRVAFVLTALAALVLAVLLRRLPEPEIEGGRRSVLTPLVAIARSRTTLFVLLLAFTEGMILLGGLTLLPAAVESSGTSASVAGAVAAVYGASVYFCARLVGRLSQHWHPARLIGSGATAAAAACAVVAISPTVLGGVAAALLLGLAWTSMHSTLQTWATEVLPTARANVVSLFAGALFVGSALGAVLVAELAEQERYALIYLVGAVLCVPLGLAAGWGRWRWRRPVV